MSVATIKQQEHKKQHLLTDIILMWFMSAFLYIVQ